LVNKLTNLGHHMRIVQILVNRPRRVKNGANAPEVGGRKGRFNEITNLAYTLSQQGKCWEKKWGGVITLMRKGSHNMYMDA